MSDERCDVCMSPVSCHVLKCHESNIREAQKSTTGAPSKKQCVLHCNRNIIWRASGVLLMSFSVHSCSGSQFAGFAYMMIALNTFNSSLVPLIEGQCSPYPCGFEISLLDGIEPMI